MALISREDIPEEETMESVSPALHGLFLRCTVNAVRVDQGVSVVIDHSGTAFTLGDTTDGRDLQLFHVL